MYEFTGNVLNPQLLLRNSKILFGLKLVCGIFIFRILLRIIMSKIVWKYYENIMKKNSTVQGIKTKFRMWFSTKK